MDQRNLIYAIEERIGQPELFVGRKEELSFFLRWIEDIPRRLSRSTALLSRRKKGKTALVERLYNILYTQNGKVIPFYFEVQEGSKWIVDFADIFYRTFMSQYIGFKARDINFCRSPRDLNTLEETALGLDLVKVAEHIRIFRKSLEDKDLVNVIWDYAQSAPHRIAGVTGDYIVQIIDEFQFLNSEIYWDKERTRVAGDLAGSYLSLAESKIAPLLATGSWVGWLRNIIHMQLPGRFVEMELENLTREEGLEAVLNYSVMTGVPIAEDVAVYLNELVDSDPFYISAIIRSTYKNKDLTTVDGLLATLEYEVRRGTIYGTWLEYIGKTFAQVNQENAKKIVLFLTKNREREWTRNEIRKHLKLNEKEYSDDKLEKKLQMLVEGDLISEGSTDIRYRGMKDEIFYKVFRYRYEELIENFPLEDALAEEKAKEKAEIERLRRELKSFQGLYNYHKGHLLEYLLMRYLRSEGYKKDVARLADKVHNYQDGAKFTSYREVKSASISLEGGKQHEIDIWARSFEEGQDLFISVKSQEKKTGRAEVEEFLKVKDTAQGLGMKGYYIFYSLSGFDDDAIELLCRNGIMYADGGSWAVWPR